MTPLQSDYSNPEQDFWRAWNQRVADGGHQQMGQFQQEYNFNQGVQAMPLKDRIPLQYRMRQDALEAARNASMDQRQQHNDEFRRWNDIESLKLRAEAARRAAFNNSQSNLRTEVRDIGRQIGQNNPMDAWETIRTTPGGIFGGNVPLPDKNGVDQMQQFSPLMVDRMYRASMLSQGRNPDAHGFQPHAGFTPDMKDVSSAAAMAARPRALTPEELERLKRYQAQNASEAESLIAPEDIMYGAVR